MKNYITIIALSVVLFAGCQKAQMKGQPERKGMIFRASIQTTKSHFESDDPQSKNPALFWDNYDDLAVYSVDPSDPTGSVVSGVAYIQPDGVGEKTAEFRSYRQESEWYRNANEDGSKHFFAYYPAPAPNDFDVVNGELVLPVNVEASQYRESFGKYHLMLSRGGSFSLGDQVSFDGFTPITSLLRFQLKVDGVCEYKIRSIQVEPYIYFEGEGTTNYHSAIVIDSTTVTVFNPKTQEEEPQRVPVYEHVERLVGMRFITLSSLLSDGDLTWMRYDGRSEFPPQEQNSSGYFPYELHSLCIYSDYSDDSDGFTLNSTPSDVLYASVFPTISYPSIGELALCVRATYDVRIDFENYGYNYNVTHEGYIHIPTPGFVAGKRYDILMTLSQDEMKVVMTNDGIDFAYDVEPW